VIGEARTPSEWASRLFCTMPEIIGSRACNPSNRRAACGLNSIKATKLSQDTFWLLPSCAAMLVADSATMLRSGALCGALSMLSSTTLSTIGCRSSDRFWNTRTVASRTRWTGLMGSAALGITTQPYRPGRSSDSDVSATAGVVK
jgi:hypothetical protein